MKKLSFILLAGMLLFLVPSATAQAKGIDAPPATENSSDEIFMTYDEFTELFYYVDRDFKLKKEFDPYYTKILKERFLGKLYRVEGETMEHEHKGKTYDLPLYEIGKVCVHIPSISESLNTNLLMSSLYCQKLESEFAEALLKLDSKYKTWSIYSYMYDYKYIFIIVQTSDKEFDQEKDIGIVIRYKFETMSENFADYEYPTHDEYYEEFAGKPYNPVTPTPKPTATPTPKPTATPTPKPTATPTPEPTATPTPEPTATPTPEPTATPTPEPTATPTPEPTATPTPKPTATPTPEPTVTPIPEPTATPIPEPTVTPTPVENDIPDNNTGFFTARNIVILSTVVIVMIAGIAVLVSKKKGKE